METALPLRGIAIGLQRPTTQRDNILYDYLFTPETFPWLYDRAEWTRTLDRLRGWGYNAIFFWTGHPFTSLLPLDDWPDARELPAEQVAANMELFHWLCREGQARGIRLFMQFYNIHLSHTLARARGVPITQSTPNDLAHSYVHHVVREFVRTYPNIGLHVCLGEALLLEHGPVWLAETILPAVIEGAELGGHPHPPVMVREHHVDIKDVMARCQGLYDNLLTEQKYNGEVLTTPEPRGWEWELHRSQVGLGVPHVINVHLLSNLEPFHYAATDFIRRCCQSIARIGAEGLHLYSLRYWDWPHAADNVTPPLRQIDRDWVWYEAWARYAIDPDRDPREEAAYWDARMGEELHLDAQSASHLRRACEYAGQVAPRGLRHFGVTIGGRQAWQLGMTLSQLLNRLSKWMPYAQLWECYAPPASTMEDYIAALASGATFNPPTPMEILAELLAFADAALLHARMVAPPAGPDGDEARRFVRDIEALNLLARHYDAKVRAAIELGVFLRNSDLTRLQRAEAYLADSVEHYAALASAHGAAYRGQRVLNIPYCTVPYVASDGFTTWAACLPRYREELASLRAVCRAFRELPEDEVAAKLSGITDVDALLALEVGPIGTDVGAKAGRRVP